MTQAGIFLCFGALGSGTQFLRAADASLFFQYGALCICRCSECVVAREKIYFCNHDAYFQLWPVRKSLM